MFVAFLLTGTASFSQNNKVTIHGTLTGDLGEYDQMYFYNRMSNDSVKIVNGKYTYTYKFTEPEMKMLLPEYISKGRMMYQPFGILITEPGDYYVNSDKEAGLNASEVKGPHSMMLYLNFDKQHKEALRKVNQTLAEEFGNDWYRISEEDERFDSFSRSKDSLENLYIFPLLEAFVTENPDSYTAGYILASNRSAGTIEQKEALFAKLSPRMKNEGQGKKYGDYIEGLKAAGIGKKVKDFTLPTPNGKNFSFSELKGKYVLIDFWASWCAPCRVSFPRMRELYSYYKNENFEIYSISIDENKDAWLKAVKEEANPWPQTLDTKNISQSGFAVTAVPSTFLIDPQGKIMIMEVGFDPEGGSQIEKKIIELFGDKMSKKKEEAKESKSTKMVPMVQMQ